MRSRKLARLLIYKLTNNMKNYEKQKHCGNENGWHEPIVSLGVTSLHEQAANELNSHFPSTGVKYAETDKSPNNGDKESQKAQDERAHTGDNASKDAAPKAKKKTTPKPTPAAQ